MTTWPIASGQLDPPPFFVNNWHSLGRKGKFYFLYIKERSGLGEEILHLIVLVTKLEIPIVVVIVSITHEWYLKYKIIKRYQSFIFLNISKKSPWLDIGFSWGSIDKDSHFHFSGLYSSYKIKLNLTCLNRLFFTFARMFSMYSKRAFTHSFWWEVHHSGSSTSLSFWMLTTATRRSS